MKRFYVILLLLLSISSSIFADDINRKGFYIGVAQGNVDFEDDGLSDDYSPYGGNYNSDGLDDGTKLYFGMQFNGIIGLEGGYTQYGEFGTSLGITEYTATNLGLNLGVSFLSSQLRPFINLGISVIEADLKSSSYTVYTIEDTAVGFHYGIGFQYEPNVLRGVGFRVALERDLFRQEINDDSYNQTLEMMYVGVQYKF